MASKVWKDGTRRGMAYVEGKETARKVMEVTGRLPVVQAPRRRTASANGDAPMEGAMAVYTDRRGRPFAWQIPFDIRCWDSVTAMVSVE